MKTRLQKLSFFSLKKLAKIKNIEGKNKSELIENICSSLDPDYTIQIERYLETLKKEEPMIAQLTPAAIPAISMEKIRIDKIVSDCNEIVVKGMATARYNPNTECIEFRGGAKKAVDVTIHQPDSTIKVLAQRYVSRVIVNEGEIEGRKKEISQSDLDLLAELRGLDMKQVRNLLQGQKLTYSEGYTE